jgi:hypothetical protein
MIEHIITLVFSVVMLVFMAFPAMKIVQGVRTFIPMSQKRYDLSVILTTVLLSLLIGLFLQYW